jgi:hypothetical protein
MRLVFVNHAHPDLPHVSGMRLGYFAREMAKRGHQVVLLTATLPDATDGATAGDRLSTRLREHDWTTPVVVAVKPRRRRVLDAIRHRGVPSLLRRALTLSQFLFHGGMFADWQLAAKSVAAQLAREFRPDLVWGTFGNTSSLVLSQSLARRAGCPWLMDIKDQWTNFVPAGLRRLTAWRLRDAAGWTSNAQRHHIVASRWLRQPRSRVIYSGVAHAFYAPCQERPPATHDLLLAGSTYNAAALREYLAAVAQWMTELPEGDRETLRFVYAGSDARQVTQALRDMPLSCETMVYGQLPIAEFAKLARNAVVNTFICTSTMTGFHHKLLELLVCGRPIVCFPDSSEENRLFASQIDCTFASCASQDDVRRALAGVWAGRTTRSLTTTQPAWRWSDRAAELEQFFQSIALQSITPGGSP